MLARLNADALNAAKEMGPSSASTASTSDATSAADVASQSYKRTPASAAATSASFVVAVRAAAATTKPPARKRWTTALPMPGPAPSTSATRGAAMAKEATRSVLRFDGGGSGGSGQAGIQAGRFMPADGECRGLKSTAERRPYYMHATGNAVGRLQFRSAARTGIGLLVEYDTRANIRSASSTNT